jgi:hypothetical protein
MKLYIVSWLQFFQQEIVPLADFTCVVLLTYLSDLNFLFRTIYHKVDTPVVKTIRQRIFSGLMARINHPSESRFFMSVICQGPVQGSSFSFWGKAGQTL